MESIVPLESIPSWYRTPRAQTVALGIVFVLLFAAYSTIQFYSAQAYGEALAATSVSALYGSFTLFCLVAPSLTKQWGSRRTMAVSILGGYDAFVVFSLFYFRGYCGAWMVVLGGVLLGLGAALLWTAQGKLILEYAAVADRLAASESNNKSQSGTLLGIFWAVYQCSALVGGTISFLYYFQDGTASDVAKPTGTTQLYLIFLLLMTVSAGLTQALLPPSALLPPTSQKELHDNPPSENTVLLRLSNNDLASSQQEPASSSWIDDTKETCRLFAKTRSLQILGLIFFYTGYNQPYQQVTYTRLFSKRTIGMEMILFRLSSVVGSVSSGRLLDHRAWRNARQSAIACLVLFLVVNGVGNLLAAWQESKDGTAGDIDIASPRWTFGRPSLAQVCWGFADAQISVYCYWILGKLFTPDEKPSAVAFFKCVQSLGYTLGFYLIPTETRMTAMHQLGLSSTIFLLGTLLAFFQLPP